MRNIITLNVLLFVVLFVSGSKLFSQNNYERGYYIDNANKRVECLIEKAKHKINPTAFNYKFSVKSVNKKLTIDDVKEFGISGFAVFERHTVKIDRSSDLDDKLSKNREPEYSEETLFLKQLVAGKAALYSYADQEVTRFFIKKGDFEPEQLLYKRYKNKDNYIIENNSYKQHLWLSFKEYFLNSNDFDRVEYKEEDLVKLFKTINKHVDPEYIKKENLKNDAIFKLSLRPGVKFYHLDYKTSSVSDQATGVNFRFGIESEMFLSKNRLSMILEMTYQSLKTEIDDYKITYKSIEIPIGLRFYIMNTKKAQVFINGAYTLDMNFGTEAYNYNIGLINLYSKNSLSFGLGGYLSKRLLLEFRYQTGRDLFKNFSGTESALRGINVIVGYNLVSK